MEGPSKLRRYLREHKLTQEQFAVSADIPGPQISMWLSKKRRRRPGLMNALKIEAATHGYVRSEDWTPRRGRPSAHPRHA